MLHWKIMVWVQVYLVHWGNYSYYTQQIGTMYRQESGKQHIFEHL